MRNALSCISLAKLRNNSFNAYNKLNNNSSLKTITNSLKWNILSSIRYKHIQGVRIGGAGRLSQRLTAARALSKVRSIGNLKNSQMINLNKNYTLLRGNVKPNVHYTNLNAKTRNGAFGLKGWINSN